MGMDSASSSVTASMLPSESASSAAPSATHSSGCTPLRGGLPKCSWIFCCTSGMRLWPPTRMISSMLDLRLMPFSVEHPVAELEGAVHQVRGQRVELLARERDAQVQRLALALLDVGQLDDHVGDAA